MKRFARSTIWTAKSKLLGRAGAKEGPSSATNNCNSLLKHSFHSHSLSYMAASVPRPRSYVSTPSTGEPKKASKKTHSFIPKKAPVSMTETTRKFFKALLKSKESDTDIVGIMLNYHQSSSGEPRMVFGFDFVRANQLDKNDERCVSMMQLLRVTPKCGVCVCTNSYGDWLTEGLCQQR
jgi:hypothetical protein